MPLRPKKASVGRVIADDKRRIEVLNREKPPPPPAPVIGRLKVGYATQDDDLVSLDDTWSDVSGLEVTIDLTGLGDTPSDGPLAAVVWGSLLLNCDDTVVQLLEGRLVVDGNIQADRIQFSSAGDGGRASVGRQWLIPALSPDSHTFKLQAHSHTDGAEGGDVQGGSLLVMCFEAIE